MKCDYSTIYANLVILQYLGSPFTWDKVFKVLRPLPDHVKNQRLYVHILYYILFNYFVACFHLSNLSCADASLQIVVAKVEDGANLTI